MLPSDAFRLGSVTVVPSINRLVWPDRADDLEPRVMRVLAVLAETPGEVVARGDLLDAVWGETVVNEDALTRAVSELRKALGDQAGAIETIRGRGYRLKIPVQTVSDGPSGEAAAPPPRTGELPAKAASAEKPPADGSPVRAGFAEGLPADRQPAAPPASQAPRGPGPFVLLALGVALLALVVALWAVRPSPSVEPETSALDVLRPGTLRVGDETLRPNDLRADDEPFPLDSTSQFYRPGMSELGVYYDSTMDRHFRLAPDTSQDRDTSGFDFDAP